MSDFQFPDIHITRDIEEDGETIREVVTSPVCDLCHDIRVTWTYPAETFTLDEGHMAWTDNSGWGSTGDWAICERCATMIEAGDTAALIRRAAQSKIKMLGEPAMQAFREASIIVPAFLAHRDGPREAFG